MIVEKRRVNTQTGHKMEVLVARFPSRQIMVAPAHHRQIMG